MSFQNPITIQEVIDGIRTQKYLLPAIQREFVWRHNQITRLFDSIMRDYPINSFLFWQIDDDNKHRFQFYQFLQTYRQRYETHNPEANVEGLTGIQAVLDGQQRLTSLYIGFTGTYAYKRRRVWWADNDYVLPPRRLFLNISRDANEQDMVYDFQWLIEKKTPLLVDAPYHIDKNGEIWFLTGRILDFPNREELDEFLDNHDFGASAKYARRTLRHLWDVIHKDERINYFLEKSQKIDKVVDIFIRTNAGGTRLSFSDLLLSMATAGWEKIDARREIYRLVDEMNGHGYTFSKDFVLKNLLVLFSRNIRFKIENFNSENISVFEENWTQARQAIVIAVQTVKKLGFSNQTLRSHNALIPVVYYVFQRGCPSHFDTAVRYEQDRRQIAKYLHIALLTRLFGRQPDSILTALRDVIASNSDAAAFPLDQIMSKCEAIGRSVSFSPELGQGLLRTQKNDSYAFSILALLYPNLDYNHMNYHKDHLHPGSVFTKENLDVEGITDPDKR
ncbi:MAG TPA: DUF262 domain-containing protein, partial [Anaerolineae bacterium]|nr:DUF262 domain-containing protein [Anaerolineae bacterium]